MGEEELYCIIMANVPSKKKFDCVGGREPYSLVLKGKDDPATFTSVDDAVECANAFKKWHPEVKFEVRPYFGKSKYLFEIAAYGQFQIGKEIMSRC